MARFSLSLAEAAEFYGISEDMLALYEKEGLVAPFKVGEDSYFTPRDRVRIEIILKSKRLGFSLNEVKTLIIAHLPAPPVLDRSQIEAQIAHLEDEKGMLQLAIDGLRAQIKSTPETL